MTTEAWQADVIAVLRERGITVKDFAKKMRCAPSTMHDLLHVAGKSSHLVPKINKFFGWQAPGEIPRSPSPPLPSPDAIEVAMMFDQLPEELRKVKIAELRALLQITKPSND